VLNPFERKGNIDPLHLKHRGLAFSPYSDLLEKTVEGYYFRSGCDEWLHRSEPMFEGCDFRGGNSEKEKGLKVFIEPAQNIALDVVCTEHRLITDARVRWVIQSKMQGLRSRGLAHWLHACLKRGQKTTFIFSSSG